VTLTSFQPAFRLARAARAIHSAPGEAR